jgi:3-oxoacyl-[acyl-carrier-protein] synthase-3
MDIGAACTGFLSALALAAGQIEAERARNVLVIGADLMSRITDHDDRRTAALFGDGAGAVLLRATAGPGRIGPVALGADASGAEFIRMDRGAAVVRMQGHETYREAVARLAEATVEAAALAAVDLDEIDLFVYHQANGRILRAVGERLRLPPERVVDCIADYGNTSAATLPLALAAAESDGRLRPGDRVLLAAFGAGFTWGAGVIEWGEA